MTRRLFVYGTLAPGRANEHVLKAIEGAWEEASVKGYLIPQGWGADMGYPGIVLDDNGDEIQGYIFYSDKLNDHLEELDFFEGEQYERVMTKVFTKDGMGVEAYVYVIRER